VNGPREPIRGPFGARDTGSVTCDLDHTSLWVDIVQDAKAVVRAEADLPGFFQHAVDAGWHVAAGFLSDIGFAGAVEGINGNGSRPAIR
jgi:hypothetical protein